MKYFIISCLSMGAANLLQVETDLSSGTTWGIIVVLAGVISTLAIVYYKRERERERLFQKLYEDHKNEIRAITEKAITALTENKNSNNLLAINTKENTDLLRELKDLFLTKIK